MKAFTVPTIFTALDKMSAPVAKMQASMNSFVGRMKSGIGQVSTQMLSFISVAALAGAIVGGIAFSGKAIMDYETSVKSFRTIVSDLNDSDFSKYESKIREVALSTKKSSIDVAKSFEMIAGLNAKFAETPEAIAAVTQSAIILSKASRDDLGKSASNLTGILNQFNLQAEDSARIINVLAAGQAVGASSITQTADAFTVFGAVAKAANITFEQSVGLVEVLASKQIQGAEAGTALRGSIIQLQKAGLGYKSGVFQVRDALIEYNQNLSKLTTAKKKDAYADKVFGTINRTSGTILATNIKLLDEYTKGVTGTSEATKAAEINSDTLANRFQELSNKWQTLITTSDKSKTSTNLLKKALTFLENNLDTILVVTGSLLVAFVAWKTLLISAAMATTLYNVAIGVYNALTGRAVVYTAAQTVAMKSQMIATRAITAAQWLWNAAMSANPIGLIVIGIAALVAIVTMMIVKWNEWGAALSFVLGPFGFLVSIIQSFRRNWYMIENAFSKGGVIAGIKAIGVTIFDAMLMPLKQVADILYKITGAQTFKNVSKGVEAVRNALAKSNGLNVTTDESGDVLPSVSMRKAEKEAMQEAVSVVKTYTSRLILEDKTGRGRLENENPNITMPVVGSTHNGWSVTGGH